MDEKLSGNNLILPVVLSTVLAAIYLLGQIGANWLAYDRNLIIHGEVWRIITAHVTHVSFNHLMLNLVGLIMVFLIFGRLFSNRFWLLGIAVCMSGISLGLFIADPNLKWYMGLSGVLHGLTVIGIAGAIKSRWPFSYFFLSAIVAKLILEQFHGPSPDTKIFIHSPVIVDAHLYGAIIGLFFALAYFVMPKTSHKAT